MTISAESRQFLSYVASQPKGRVGYGMLGQGAAEWMAAECLEAGYVKQRRYGFGFGYQITEAGKAFLGGEQL